MVGLLACMDNAPAGLVPDLGFVIVLVADEEVGVDFNHGRQLGEIGSSSESSKEDFIEGDLIMGVRG